MTTLMHHGRYIMHLTGSIHEYEGGARFRQWTVIAARGFAYPAFEVKTVHIFHGQKAIRKKGTQGAKASHGFFQEFFSRIKRTKGQLTSRFCFHIPGPE